MSQLACLFVDRGSNEWRYMWDALARHKSNSALPEPTVAENFGEVWQYMETDRVPTGFIGRMFGRKYQYFHCFRHRMHPEKGAYRLRVPATAGFSAR